MLDKDDLQNTYMILGQIDEALKMYREDADASGEHEQAGYLRNASVGVVGAQASISKVLRTSA